jgi:hypothetical protein
MFCHFRLTFDFTFGNGGPILTGNKSFSAQLGADGPQRFLPTKSENARV